MEIWVAIFVQSIRSRDADDPPEGPTPASAREVAIAASREEEIPASELFPERRLTKRSPRVVRHAQDKQNPEPEKARHDHHDGHLLAYVFHSHKEEGHQKCFGGRDS